MSYVIDTYLECNVCETARTGFFTFNEAVPRREMYKRAKEKGWTQMQVNKHKYDICPDCAKMPKEEIRNILKSKIERSNYVKN